MMELSNYLLHEADVLDLRQDGGKVALVLGGVKCATGACGLIVNFCGTLRIKIDSAPAEEIGMYFDDGEVLGLSERSDGNFELLIEWNDFNTHTQVTKFYEIACEALQIEQCQERLQTSD